MKNEGLKRLVEESGLRARDVVRYTEGAVVLTQAARWLRLWRFSVSTGRMLEGFCARKVEEEVTAVFADDGKVAAERKKVRGDLALFGKAVLYRGAEGEVVSEVGGSVEDVSALPDFGKVGTGDVVPMGDLPVVVTGEVPVVKAKREWKVVFDEDVFEGEKVVLDCRYGGDDPGGVDYLMKVVGRDVGLTYGGCQWVCSVADMEGATHFMFGGDEVICSKFKKKQ